MIASEASNPLIKGYIEFLLMSAKNLKVIVNDVLDLSRIEAGKLKLVIEPISIKEVIKIRIKNFKVKHKDSKVQLNYLLSDQIPSQVLGDSVRVTQILANLINNSFKFTKKGSITVEAELFSEKKESVIINLSVKDTGRGMSAEQISKIFKEYEQTELSDHREHGGVGLGLSIVKRLVDAMNGKIFVESELNSGTTFIVQIPFQKVNSSKNIEAIESKLGEQSFDLKGIEVLFADDDKLNHAIVSHLLSKEETEITMVNDGLEALTLLKKKKFDIVLLDINMPNLSGEELIKRKKLFTKFNSKTPILALTGNTSEEDIKRYLALGFSSVVPKPYSSVELKTAMCSVVKK